MHNLRLFNFCDEIYNWCYDFLIKHFHGTKWAEIVSEHKEINCGIVQGSVVGPLLFLIASCDLLPCNKLVSYVKYADDTIIIMPSMNNILLNDEQHQINAWTTKCN